uniref:C2H2-type domain-containing protein n=1 Tax=viral metagenome TaxID=1070528 RepID=A0A6M3KFK9_9ZZZZ
MSEYLQGRKWSEIQKLSFDELCKMPCVEIVDENGEAPETYSVFLLIPTTEFLQFQFDAKGGLSNTNYHPENEIVPDSLTCPECGKVCGSKLGLISHMRTHKKEMVSV